MMKPISNYFAVQSKKVYILHEELENEMYREEMGKKKEKDALDAEKKLVVEQARSAKVIANHKRAEACRNRVGVEMICRQDPVNEELDNICCEERPPENGIYKKRKQLERPKNWEIIAQFRWQDKKI